LLWPASLEAGGRLFYAKTPASEDAGYNKPYLKAEDVDEPDSF
jgi:hypothetical protein